MPYIIKSRRKPIDRSLDLLIDAIITDLETKTFDDGSVNYAITRLLLRLYSPINYAKINRAIGVLECAKLELYRRIAAPYEDRKLRENGDIL